MRKFPKLSNCFDKPGKWLLLCLLALLPITSHADDLRVLLMLSDNSLPYQTFATVLRSSIHANKTRVEIVESLPAGRKADLIMAVGTKATESAIARSDAPVLGVMIPKIGYETLLKGLPSQQRSWAKSAIYIDQPWERQLDFIQAVLPKHRRIGLLHSPDTQLDMAGLRNETKVHGLLLNAQAVQSSVTLFATLDAVLGESDVLLAIPDSTIYNSSNVRNILLTSYRHKVPLIGISQGYVNAGALCAIYSTPEQQAEQAVEAIVSFVRNRQLPEPQYPDSYSIGLNQQVARSLGIVLNSQEAIRERMDKVEGGRR